MGRRLRAMWRLRQPRAAHAPGPGRPRALARPAPGPPRGGRRADHRQARRPARPRSTWSNGWSTSATGGRCQVEHRGQVARRGSIVDVFPSTADHPVRIDLWGDEVDRLTRFSVTDQRSTDDVDCVEIFPSRELLPTDEVTSEGGRAGRHRAVGPGAVGAAGRGRRVRGHGVVAAVAHRGRAHPVRPARPRRPRPAGRAPPHARPGRRPARRGGVARRQPGHHLGRRPKTGSGPASTSPSTASWPTPRPRRGPSPARPRAPTSPPSSPGAGTR